MQRCLSSIYKNRLLSKIVYDRIRPVRSQRPHMYALPKVHKESISPFLSMLGYVQHELLQSLPFSTCCVSDSFRFSSFIRNSGSRSGVLRHCQSTYQCSSPRHFTNLYWCSLYRSSPDSFIIPVNLLLEFMQLATEWI